MRLILTCIKCVLIQNTLKVLDVKFLKMYQICLYKPLKT